MHVFMYFLHLVPTFPPHDIIAEMGLLHAHGQERPIQKLRQDLVFTAREFELRHAPPPPPHPLIHTSK